MAFIEVKQGGVDLPEGVYTVALVSISEPKTIFPQSGVNAGKEVVIRDWTWMVADGPYRDTEIQSTTSTASGPKSKIFSYLTALLGGIAPQVGTKIEESSLIGRPVLATIRRTEDGWPRIETLSAMPSSMVPSPTRLGTTPAEELPF
jgi:hypothetical protein